MANRWINKSGLQMIILRWSFGDQRCRNWHLCSAPTSKCSSQSKSFFPLYWEGSLTRQFHWCLYFTVLCVKRFFKYGYFLLMGSVLKYKIAMSSVVVFTYYEVILNNNKEQYRNLSIALS